MKFLKGLICLTAAVFVVSCILSAGYLFRPDIPDNIETSLSSDRESVEMTAGDRDMPEGRFLISHKVFAR